MISEDERDNTRVAEFGYGTIRISRARLANEQHESMLILSSQIEPQKVGSVDPNSPYIDKDSGEIPGNKIKLHFSNVEGLDALVLELATLRSGLTANPTTEKR